MDYLVIISPSPYHYWQTELLIESFQMQNLEKKLVVGIYGNDTEMPINISQHQRKFIFTPGNEDDIINKFYGIYLAKREKLVGSSFAVIHPDMVLMHPLPDFNENVVFNIPEEDSELRYLIPKNYPWITIDGVAIFQDVPFMFFQNALNNCQTLKVPRKLAKTAWAKTMYEYSKLLSFLGTNLEVGLIHETEASFIHYRYGLKPYFDKNWYKNYPNIALSNDPFNTIVSYTPTSTAQFLKNVVVSYMKKTVKPEIDLTA